METIEWADDQEDRPLKDKIITISNTVVNQESINLQQLEDESTVLAVQIDELTIRKAVVDQKIDKVKLALNIE